jgi:hypothetical protein
MVRGGNVAALKLFQATNKYPLNLKNNHSLGVKRENKDQI